MPASYPEQTPYPHLLSPLDLGFTSLRNRTIMGSMHMRFELLDNAAERAAAFYAARARGGVGLIVTGGVAPNPYGRMDALTTVLQDDSGLESHRAIAEAVHGEGGKVCMQILHAGRYAHIEETVGASNLPTPINKVAPRALSAEEVERTVADYVECAALAQMAGYDGVEIMASEGYLITQFCAPRTNDRTDQWGGSFEGRTRFAREIVRRTRERVGRDFIILFRISGLDLIEDGLTGEDTARLARDIEAAGADILSSGVGWHEARIPTIAHMVPRASWRFVARRLKQAVSIPVVASNRINAPGLAEDIIAAGDGDLVALARPLLADPDFVAKAAAGRADDINTCIACNQACLDYIFGTNAATCLVNPRAGRELDFADGPAAESMRLAVVGAGPAGLAFAATAAERGHDVTLYEAADEIGGQFNLAKRIPGKAEFAETIRYFARRLDTLGVTLRLATRPAARALADDGFDVVIVATGVHPRRPDIEGFDHPKAISYADLIGQGRVVGDRVAIIGSGGIAFDVAEYLTAPETPDDDGAAAFLAEWGVDTAHRSAGGLDDAAAAARPAVREITMLQRSPGRPGRRLGVTTSWISRATLRRRGVRMISGAQYHRIDNAGLHFTADGESQILDVDAVVVCAGQEPARELYDELAALGVDARIIGGAETADGLNALRAIDQAVRLAMTF